LNIENVGEFEAEYMADSLTDWLDSDDVISGIGGAEDSDYESKEFPYLAANSLLTSVNELRIIEHFTPAVIRALKDYVCVLPTNQLVINVNTVTEDKALLISSVLGIDQNDVEQALAARPEKGFEKIDDFLNAQELSKSKIDKSSKQFFTVDSEFFKLAASTRFANSFYKLNSIFQVEDNHTVRVISRTIGTE
jgi:general secretion pathway protein K